MIRRKNIKMDLIYRISVLFFTVIILIANHMESRLFCNIGGISIIVISLVYSVLKKRKN